MLRITIAGAAGRMGRALTQTVHKNHALELVGATDRAGSSVIGTDLGELAGIGSVGVMVRETLPAESGQFDLLIDFTTPKNTLNNLALCAELGVPAVVGTTGLNSEEIDQLKSYSEIIPLCFAANYSTGVTLCMQLVQQAALSLIHISEPTRRRGISYAVFCLKKKKRKSYAVYCLKKKKIKKKKKNIFFFFFLMIRRPPRSTPLYSSAASDVYKRQEE